MIEELHWVIIFSFGNDGLKDVVLVVSVLTEMIVPV